MKKLLLALLMPTMAFANLNMAPPNLELSRESKGVFVDFKTINTQIIYDVKTAKATAKSFIEFNQKTNGKPIFDLINDPTKVLLNNEEVTTTQTSMNGISKVRYINRTIAQGNHKLYIENLITKNVSFSGQKVRSAFWMSDLSDRRFLEQYIPANLEFDQYKINFEVKIINSDIEHELFTNGEVQKLTLNHWKVSYPETFSASSLFFHFFERGYRKVIRKTYKSIDGRIIPVTAYSNWTPSRFMSKSLEILAELEQDYGPWPHNQLIVYGAGSGGMEYSGATITSMSALGHELIHSYFARAVMPAHGNAGWVDEAIASWRDKDYRLYQRNQLSRSKMASHSIYKRTTDRDAYSKGMRFVGYLGAKFKEKENFKVFLKDFFSTRKFKPFKTDEFKTAIEEFYNTNLDEDFDTFIYGKNGVDKTIVDSENKYHPKLTDKEIYNLL